MLIITTFGEMGIHYIKTASNSWYDFFHCCPV